MAADGEMRAEKRVKRRIDENLTLEILRGDGERVAIF